MLRAASRPRHEGFTAAAGHAMLARMPKSSISKLHDIRPNSQFAVGLGNAIRERRRARGMTQSELAAPFTKGFISEVERGHSLPSLRALTLVADRLGVSASELLDSVKEGLPWVYTPADEDKHASAPPGHR